MSKRSVQVNIGEKDLQAGKGSATPLYKHKQLKKWIDLLLEKTLNSNKQRNNYRHSSLLLSVNLPVP